MVIEVLDLNDYLNENYGIISVVIIWVGNNCDLVVKLGVVEVLWF